MKLLFDANLSPKLVIRLAELFPGSLHVFETGLVQNSSDELIWAYARANGLTIVTADSDFIDLAKSRGAPPKIVQLLKCNYRTARVEELLRRNAVRLVEWEHGGKPIVEIRNT